MASWTRIRQAEPLWYLRAVPYSTYLNTDHWQLLRRQFLQMREEFGGLSCDRCGIKELDEVVEEKILTKAELEDNTYVHHTGNDGRERTTRWVMRQPQWNVHHKTYERLGEEEFNDLQLLCVMCHNLEHFPESHAARYWVGYLQEKSFTQHVLERLERGE